MTAKVIDGKAFAEKIRKKVAVHVERIKKDHGITPGLAVVLVGEDPASQVYVRNKGKQTVEAGMNSYEHKLDASTSEADLLAVVDKLNNDDAVHGILVQLPLPDHINEDLVINSISPAKDADGFHISNVGLLGTGQKSMVPCTPLGCLMMLREQHGSLSGLNAVVVPEMITGDWVKPGATVIDVGINRIDAPEKGAGKTRLVGDVHYESASQKAGAITPVPGGVGPMTIACLLANTVTACSRANGLEEPSDLTA